MGSGASKKDCRSETSTEGDFNGKRVEVPPLRSRLRTHLGKQKVTLLEKRRGGEVFWGGEFGGCTFTFGLRQTCHKNITWISERPERVDICRWPVFFPSVGFL